LLSNKEEKGRTKKGGRTETEKGPTDPFSVHCGEQPVSDIQVGNLQGIGLDKLPARIHIVTHQAGKDLVCGDGVLDGDLQHTTAFRIHGGFPQLFRVHFAQPLVALEASATASLNHQPFQGIGEVANGTLGLTTLDISIGSQQAFQGFPESLDFLIVR